MSTIFQRITKLFTPTEALTSGVYHYQSPPEADLQYRLHLRIGSDGEGILIVNASTILHLNQTGTEFAYHIIQGASSEEAARAVADRYKIDRSEARLDFLEVSEKIKTLIEVPDLDPITFLDISREDPYSANLSAPFRLDCALTYQQTSKSKAEYAPHRRVDRELTTEEWFTILDRAWDSGIPHIIFTGGEPTLREDLIALIAHAEENGQVTGLCSEGYLFNDPDFRKQILFSGLDHLLFLLSPLDKESWDALKAILNEDLYTTVHITIDHEIMKRMDQVINSCRELGANAISLSISDPDDQDLNLALETAQSLTAESGLPLKWDLPVPYSAHNPIALENEVNPEQVPGAGKAWFYVEPDGDVLPTQGVNQVL
jgi:hypothetical protein